MKTILTTTLICFILIQNLLVAQNVSASLNGTFIEGVSTVNNSFTYDDNSTYASGLLFEALDGSSNVVSQYTDNTPTGTAYTWPAMDMGLLNPNSAIRVTNIQSTNVLETYTLNVIQKPDWLIAGGIATVYTITGNIINIDGSYPISSVSQTIPNSIKAIGGKQLDLANCRLELNIDYDYTNQNSSMNSSSAVLNLNTLGQMIASKTITFSSGSFNVDNDFNISAVVKDSIEVAQYDCNFSGMNFPVCPGVNIKIDAGVSFLADLKGQIVLGQISNQFGFVDNGNAVTKLTARMQADGFIRGSVKVLYGAASASARLDITGRLGIGFEYESVPVSTLTPLFGGDIDVSGRVDLETFWGFGPNKSYGPTSFFYNSFGNLSAVNKSISSSFDNTFGSNSKTYKTNGSLALPSDHPMPSFGNRDNKLYITWIENDINGTGYLLMTKLDTTGTCFSNENIIAFNDNSISNPKIALMPDGSALITWTQNRYNSATLPSNLPTSLLFNSQDVWGAIYDNALDSITEIFRLSDDTTSLSSGRGEGEASISMGSGNEGIITWIAKDLVNSESDIMFSHITKTGNVWSLTNSAILNNGLTGINKDVQVSYIDNTNAVAVWINDPDGKDSTNNNLIYTADWDGSTWSVPIIFAPNPNNDVEYTELSLASNNSYCAVAWTSTEFNNNGTFTNFVDVEVYDYQNSQWNSSKRFTDYDTTYYFQKPRISISDEGIASLVYQAIDMFPDTNYIDPGQINLFLNNLNSYSSNWTSIDNNQFASDTTTYIWSLDAGFGNNNVLYTISQEYSENTGPVAIPNNGILFGDHSLSMVFRAMKVNNNLSITNVTEPNCNVPIGINEQSLNKKPESNLLQNYPNPFDNYTIIEFTIRKPGSVKLEIIDVFGRNILTLLDVKLNEGIYQTKFEPNNLETGIYFYKLTCGKTISTRKMIITK